MLRFIFSTLFTLLLFTLLAQPPVPALKNNKWGYLDKNLNWVVQPGYDEALPFSEGLASVKKDNKWGYINEKGAVIMPLDFDEALPFEYGVATIKKNSLPYNGYQHNKYQLIDKSGKIVSAVNSDRAFEFHEGLSIVTRGNLKKGNVSIDSIGIVGYMNTQGKMVIVHPEPLMVKANEFYNQDFIFSEGLCVSPGEVGGRKGFGYIDKTGRMVIPPSITLMAKKFSNGLASVAFDYSSRYYINKKGERMFSKTWLSQPGSFVNGYALVNTTSGSKTINNIIIDTTGKEIISIASENYYDLVGIINNIFLVGKPKSGYFLYNKAGKQILGPTYTSKEADWQSPPVAFNEKGLWCFYGTEDLKEVNLGIVEFIGVMDSKGKGVGTYQGAFRFKYYKGGYIGLYANHERSWQPSFFIDEYGFAYKAGTQAVTPEPEVKKTVDVNAKAVGDGKEAMKSENTKPFLSEKNALVFKNLESVLKQVVASANDPQKHFTEFRGKNFKSKIFSGKTYKSSVELPGTFENFVTDFLGNSKANYYYWYSFIDEEPPANLTGRLKLLYKELCEAMKSIYPDKQVTFLYDTENYFHLVINEHISIDLSFYFRSGYKDILLLSVIAEYPK